MGFGRKRLLIFAGVAAVFLVSFVLAPRLKVNESITDLLPMSDPMTADYHLVVTQFRVLESLFIDVGANEQASVTQSEIISIADNMVLQLERSGLFQKIFYRISSEQALETLSAIQRSQSSLFSIADLNQIKLLISEKSIREKLVKAKRDLTQPFSPFVRKQIRRDPLGFDTLLQAKLKSLSAKTIKISDGRIWNKNGNHLLIIATPKTPAMDTHSGKTLIKTIESAKRKALQCSPKGSVRISYAGGHRAALDNATTIKTDVHRSVTFTWISILVLGLLVFRRKRLVGLMFLPAAFGIAVGVIVSVIFTPTISAIAIGCSALFISISVDYGVHLLYRFDNLPAGTNSFKNCAKSMIIPLTMSACTTAVGLLCLLCVSLPGQRQVGFLGAVGVLAAAAFACIALPVFMPTPRGTTRRALPLTAYCQQFLDWRERHKYLFLLLSLVVFLFGLLGITKVTFDGDVSKLNYQPVATKQDERQILKTWDTSAGTSVVVQGATQQQALEANDLLYQELRQMKLNGKITGFHSIAQILPAKKTQLTNQRRWQQFWSPQQKHILQARLTKAAWDLGFSPIAFDPFIQSLSSKPKVITIEKMKGISLDTAINNHIATDGKQWLILSRIKLKSRTDLKIVENLIKAKFSGTIVLDRKNFMEHTVGLIRNDVGSLVLIATACILVCLWLFLRRIELVLAVLLPVLFGLVVTMGIQGLWGIPFNMFSCIFIVFIFGLGIDYSIFLLNSKLDKYRGFNNHDAVTFGAVLACLVSTLVGFVALAMANHPGLHSIGITGAIGMLSSLVTAVVIIPFVADVLLPTNPHQPAPSLRNLVGSGVIVLHLVTTSLVYSCLLRFIVRLRYTNNRQARQHFARKYAHWAAAFLLRHLPSRNNQHWYLGELKELEGQAGIIVANHCSAFDIFLVLSLPTEMVMVVKGWVWNSLLLGRIARDAGFVLVEGKTTSEIYSLAKQRLEEGVHVMFFPEGTRSSSCVKMQRFHMGAFDLAVRIECDVIPLLLSNTQACISSQSMMLANHHKSALRVLERVTPDSFDYSQGSRAMGRHIKEAMQTRQGEDWKFTQNSHNFWTNLRTLYNYRGAFVESFIAWKLRLDPIYGHIDKWIPETGFVFDAGCGYGLMSQILARKSFHREVFGMDWDHRKVNIASMTARNAENLSFRQGDLFTERFPESDAILLVDVLHYWTLDKQRLIIEKACQSLRTGGVLLLREACLSKGLSHRLTVLAEKFAVKFGHNKRGDGLFFNPEKKHMKIFSENQMQFCDSPEHLSRGSNKVFVFKKRGLEV